MNLAKLLDCFRAGVAGQPASSKIINAVQPVGEPEVAYGWTTGAPLFKNQVDAAPAIGSTLASVTITEDCFYWLDAQPFIVPGTTRETLVLEIVDDKGVTIWQLPFHASNISTANIGTYQARLHLKMNWIVRWRNLTSGAGTIFATGLALRKLWQI